MHMPPPSKDSSLHLLVLPKPLRLVALPKDAVLPAELAQHLLQPTPDSLATFLSVTRTDEELSIVTDADLDFDQASNVSHWRALKVRGPMDLSLTGILNALTAPLKAAAIPIFALSTWNTDYVLVNVQHLSSAVAALKEDGWTFVAEDP